MRRILLPLLLIPLLSACDSLLLTEEEQMFQDLADETTALREEFRGVPVTPAAAIPLTGTADYAGTAVINIATPGTVTELIGDAAITADFRNDTVTGRLDGFYGAVADDEVRAWTGGVNLSNGTIDVARTNDIAADILGVLRDGSHVVTVDGGIAGNFLGTTPRAVEAKATSGTEYTVDGVVRSGGISILAAE